MSVSSEVISKLLGQATAQHHGGRLDDAERTYQYVLTLAPRNFDALHRLGIVAMQRGLHAEALTRIDRALAVEPGSARALFNRGTTLLGLHRHDLAHDALTAVVRLTPDDGDAHFMLGNVEMARERFEEAVACYDRALELKPGDIAVISNRASALGRCGRAEEGLTSIEAALTTAPEDADLHYNHGILAKQLGRRETAEASFRRAIEIAPRHARAQNGLAMIQQGTDSTT